MFWKDVELYKNHKTNLSNQMKYAKYIYKMYFTTQSPFYISCKANQITVVPVKILESIDYALFKSESEVNSEIYSLVKE